ncbi:MAG: hypothetical protein KGN97_07540 [Bacteroidota bacterium]|nr:hypothetical protein [Bacteroidota bacterium]
MKKNILILTICTALISACKSTSSTTSVESPSMPKYTTVDQIYNLNIGMTMDEVSTTLGIKPYDIYTSFENGYKVLIYNYKHKYMNVDSIDQHNLENIKRSDAYYIEPNRLYVVFDKKTDKMISFITDKGRGETIKNINNALQLRFLSSNPNDLYKSLTANSEESKKESKKENIENKTENAFNQLMEAKKKAKKMKADLLD